MKTLRPLALVSTLACAACAAAVPAGSPPRATSTPSALSSPPAYAAVAISAEAGARYFLETGGGDPYNAGIAYPVFLALMAAYPNELGRDWNEFADKFGFLSDPKAKGDPSALPIGFHLTTDPATGVPWVVADCQLCHADRLRLLSGDVTVAGMGNKRVRPHAYADALARIATDPGFEASRIEALAAQRAEALSVPFAVAYLKTL